MPSYVIFISAFLVSFALVPLAISLAHNRNAIALPGKRHIHTRPTPKFGGIAIALSVFLISTIVFSVDRIVGAYLASSALILMHGILDDIKGISWKANLFFTFTATTIFIAGTNLWVTDLGNLFGFGEIHLGLWGIPFTYFAIFGVVNAINLIDGLNGLACGVSSIAFLSFAIFASMSGNDVVFYLSLANLGAILGLFKYNYPQASIFMGNSGSLFLGFSLAVLAILLTQGGGTVKPMIPALILGIPIIDTLRVFIVRVVSRRHPFKGDKTHMHHLMIRSGIPLSRVVKAIWILSANMSLFAFVLYNLDSWVLLTVMCICTTFIGFLVESLKIIRSTAVRK